MRKAIVLLILILSNAVFGQEYHFDKAFTYNEIRTEFDHEFTRIVMLNKENRDYFLIMGNSSKAKGEGYKCSIYDFRTKFRHCFYVKIISDELKFEYLYSWKEQESICTKNEKLFGLADLDTKNTSKITINRYNNLADKSVVESCKIQVKEMDNTPLNVFLKSFYDNFDCCTSLNFKANCYPVNLNIEYENKKRSQIKLTNTNEVALSITINKEDLKLRN